MHGLIPRKALPMNKVRALFAVPAAAALVALSPLAASAATTGGDIDVLSGSAGSIVIWNHNGFSRYLYPGYGSYDYTGFYNDVQKFRVSSGCKARSQYSGTSYPYAGGVVYYMSQNNLNLVMYVKC